ncbi:MAG TPA: prepilin-type N-terminal cleavage/methylation domain-containing protein [Candidatus Paceibacterota bacterium]|nr:prepilin-type N-terminal cleavage/methylation domain-containing protein [Candidatus Paceibacterota bacterium]
MKKGFTLLEMLLVIAIIAILAGIVIVAINPAKQIADANNAQRRSDVLAILNAIHQYGIDNAGNLSLLNIYDDDSYSDTDQAIQGCVNDGTDASDLESYLVSSYLSAIPTDPDVSNNNGQYKVVIDSGNGRVTVCA